jgi:hypothetical protein
MEGKEMKREKTDSCRGNRDEEREGRQTIIAFFIMYRCKVLRQS